MILFRNALLILIFCTLIIFYAYSSINKPKEISFDEIKVSIKRLETVPIPNSPQKTTSVLRTPPQPIVVTAPARPTSNQTSEYSTSVSYGVPGGNQSLSVSLSLQNNIIVNISTKHSMKGDSAKYQRNFESNYQKLVIGKNIKDVNLSRVAGASLTTNAFNKAISSIRNSL